MESDKALFRMLTWTEGSFVFVQGGASFKPRINRAMDEALLEGMRQADESARLLSTLPPRTAHLVLAPDAALSTDQHPVTAQLVDLLRQPRSVTELLDLSSATDLEALVVLNTLMQKGIARIADGESEEGKAPLLGPAEVHALRAKLLRGRTAAAVVVAKAFVCTGGAPAGKRLLHELPGLVPVASEPGALRSYFGTLGRLDVSESLKLDLFMLPPSDAARPLWRPFCSGAVGGLVLDGSERALDLARYLGWEIRVPLVTVGAEVPSGLAAAPAGAVAVKEGFSEAVRALLVQALKPVQPIGFAA